MDLNVERWPGNGNSLRVACTGSIGQFDHASGLIWSNILWMGVSWRTKLRTTGTVTSPIPFDGFVIKGGRNNVMVSTGSMYFNHRSMWSDVLGVDINTVKLKTLNKEIARGILTTMDSTSKYNRNTCTTGLSTCHCFRNGLRWSDDLWVHVNHRSLLRCARDIYRERNCRTLSDKLVYASGERSYGADLAGSVKKSKRNWW